LADEAVVLLAGFLNVHEKTSNVWEVVCPQKEKGITEFPRSK